MLYSGDVGPQGVLLTRAFHWASDGLVGARGWEVCGSRSPPSTYHEPHSDAEYVPWRPEPLSDLDGPRSHQHPSLAPHARATFAALRLRGNPMTTNDLAATLPTDIRDLTSHDVCALAAGPVSVEVGRSGTYVELEGGLLEPPSLRAHGE